MPGAGELIHPYLGSLQVACTGCGLTERTREGRMARLVSLEFVEAGANQYPTSRVNTQDNVTSSANNSVQEYIPFPVPRNLWLVMAFASFVADAAIAVVQAAADEIGGPLAPGLRRNAPALVYSVRQLAVDMDAAIGVLADIDKLEALAFNALDSYPAVVGATLNRNQERNNQAALINFVRGLATVRFAARVGIEEYRDREQARANRDSTTEALDQREADANTRVFRSLRSLRAAVVEHVREELLRLPPVIVATPASVQPSLAIAYDIYEDIGRAADIVGRITLPRPGFVPANPITLPGE